MTDLHQRTLRALALNRVPGFHFIGNFLGVMFTALSRAESQVRLDTGPYTKDVDGQHNFGVVALLADVALASVVRANLVPSQRLGTVNLQLQFTGAAARGDLTGIGYFEGFLQDATGQQGLSRATVKADGQTLAFGTGAFMVLNPPPGVTMYPLVNADHACVAPLPEESLTPAERQTLALLDTAAEGPLSGFLTRLWGYGAQPKPGGAVVQIQNGPHIGNRVGHMQGGLQVGLAMAAANAALPAGWTLSGLKACFVSPGEGRVLRATARVLHRGRQTAVVQTTLTGKRRRRVLEVLSTHVVRGDTPNRV